MPEYGLSNTHIFSIRHIMIFFCLGTLDNTLTLYWGAIFNIQITIKKHKNVKNIILTYHRKELVYSTRAETRRQSTALFNPSWIHTYFAVLHMSANDCESTMSIDFGVTNKF